MTSTAILQERNRHFAKNFTHGDLPILPKMRSVILTCVDARVDPAHVLGVELGDAVVIRNNGGRVTPAVIEEIATLAFMVAKLDGDAPEPFEVVIMHHTQCGAERFADPEFRKALKAHIGVDVSSVAISNHQDSLREDIERLRKADTVPGHIIVSGYIYDVKNGQIREVAPPKPLSQ